VISGLDIGSFTIETVPQRMKQLQEDPMIEVLDASPDLASALQRVGERE
jgi:hypothetical protein